MHWAKYREIIVGIILEATEDGRDSGNFSSKDCVQLLVCDKTWKLLVHRCLPENLTKFKLMKNATKVHSLTVQTGQCLWL